MFWIINLFRMDLVQPKGFTYSFDQNVCRKCAGFCCRGGSGHIWVNGAEIAQIAGFLKKSQIDIIGMYLNPVGNRLSIKERYADGEHECVFFDAQAPGCSIYTVRPYQCRQFPFWHYYSGREEELVKECPGVRLNR